MYGFMELLEFMVAQFFMVFVESPPPGIYILNKNKLLSFLLKLKTRTSLKLHLHE